VVYFYLVHKPEKWACKDCSERERRNRNCDGDPKRESFTFHFHPRIVSTAVHQCPRSYIDPEMEALYRKFCEWKRFGLWPADGGLDNQPARLVEAFLTIFGALDTYESLEEEKKKQEAKQLEANRGKLTGGKRPPLRR
jgi:hypothetical protein